MEQYVSVVYRAYETSGLDTPGKPVNGNKLYVEVRKYIYGYKRAREKSMVLLGRFLSYRPLTINWSAVCICAAHANAAHLCVEFRNGAQRAGQCLAVL
jgi:hypothetical protein